MNLGLVSNGFQMNKSTMVVKITPKKTIELPPRTTIHGEPGIGKSTFAASAPDVVFICTEQGTNNIAVQRARIDEGPSDRDPKTYDEVLYVLNSLIAGLEQSPKAFKNVCIDTVDALETIIHQHACKISSKRSIADFRFGAGYDLTVDYFKHILNRLEILQSLGCGVILITHTKIESFNNPEGQDFNYYELKMHKKISGALVEWSDNVLFARREQYALEENGKVRGIGTGSRFLMTQKTPTYIAKNRYSLPEKLPLQWSEYESAMKDHKPADPEELRKNAQELVKKLDKETQKTAKEALSKISKDDARTLAQFIDYVRSKINISNPEEMSNVTSTNTPDASASSATVPPATRN